MMGEALAYFSRCDDLEVSQQRGFGCQARAGRSVKRGERTAVCRGEGEEIAVRELVRPLCVKQAGLEPAVGNAKVIGPELVAAIGYELAQECRRCGHGQRSLRHRSIGENTDTTHFSNRASRPAAHSRGCEPGPRRAVMLMWWPEEGDQRVTSTSATPTVKGSPQESGQRRIVDAWEIGRHVEHWQPIIRRSQANTDYAPARKDGDGLAEGIRCASARHRAASSTSSSIDRVVRMMRLYAFDASRDRSHQQIRRAPAGGQ